MLTGGIFMKRRDFIAFLGSMAIAAPRRAIRLQPGSSRASRGRAAT